VGLELFDVRLGLGSRRLRHLHAWLVVAAGDTTSFVYEVSTETLSVVGVAEVGMVPKYVAVTPNDKYVVVTNWCSWTVSIVNEATHHLVATIPVGAYPRGIAISPDSHLAYVAIMVRT